MHIAIYSRVSSNQQDHRSQELDLANWARAQQEQGNTVQWYREKATGTNYDRNIWESLWLDIQTGKIQKLVVWRLDRLGRLAGQTITLLDQLETIGCGFFSLRDGFDPSTPAGRLQRNILASVSQYETEVRSERQRNGIAAARASGKRWGGRKVGTRVRMTPEKEQQLRNMHEQGQSVSAIARVLGVSRVTVYQYLPITTAPEPQ